jgi:hypothetical protein
MSLYHVLYLAHRDVRGTPRTVLSDQSSGLALRHDGGLERAAEPARFDVYRIVPFIVLFAWVFFDQVARPSF